MSLTYSLVY